MTDILKYKFLIKEVDKKYFPSLKKVDFKSSALSRFFSVLAECGTAGL